MSTDSLASRSPRSVVVRTSLRIVAAIATMASLGGCSANGGGSIGSLRAGFDIRGASNSPCTLVVANGNASFSLYIDVPNPPVENTSLISHAQATMECTVDTSPDAGTRVTVTASTGEDDIGVWRDSTALCVDGTYFSLQAIGYNEQARSNCPVTLTLTCGGEVLYDHVAATACQFFG